MSQTRSEIRRLLARHGITPRKRLGQHFLADPNIIAKIVALAGDPARARALEIGVGTGTLTRALADAGFAVTGFEIDERLRPVLAETLGDLEVDIRFQDAARFDFSEFVQGQRWILVSNLPYQVGTSILLDLLRRAAPLERCVVMVQREVAERLTAGRGSRQYGLPSVVVGLYGEARLMFRVGPQVFLPSPRVESAVVVVDRSAAPDARRDLAVRLAAAGFRQRRKMLRSSLRSVIHDSVPTRLAAAGIDPSLRAEDLGADGYLALADAVSSAV